MSDPFLMLGIESSCDETAAAIVAGDGTILASEVASQMDIHAAHGGVVPEIAARAHLNAIDIVIETALAGAGVGIEAIDGVAATGGPGLIGGVVVGTVTAKAIATAVVTVVSAAFSMSCVATAVATALRLRHDSRCTFIFMVCMPL